MYIWGISITQSIIFLPIRMSQGILAGCSNFETSTSTIFFIHFSAVVQRLLLRVQIYFLCFIGADFLPSIATAQTIDVYIMAGQSNMDGRGDVSDLSEEQLASLQNDTMIRAMSTQGPNGSGLNRHPTRPILTSVPTVSQPWCLAALVSILLQPGN